MAKRTLTGILTWPTRWKIPALRPMSWCSRKIFIQSTRSLATLGMISWRRFKQFISTIVSTKIMSIGQRDGWKMLGLQSERTQSLRARAKRISTGSLIASATFSANRRRAKLWSMQLRTGERRPWEIQGQMARTEYWSQSRNSSLNGKNWSKRCLLQRFQLKLICFSGQMLNSLSPDFRNGSMIGRRG